MRQNVISIRSAETINDQDIEQKILLGVSRFIVLLDRYPQHRQAADTLERECREKARHGTAVKDLATFALSRIAEIDPILYRRIA